MDIIHVDMDDTIALYSEAFMRDLMFNPDIKYPQSQYGFFTKLEVMPGAVYYINQLISLYDVKVKITTRPSFKNPLCYTEKRVWVENHFGIEMCEHLQFINDKAEVKGDYLIDDVYWPGFEGEQIMFSRDPKDKHTEWTRIFNYITPKLTKKIQ